MKDITAEDPFNQVVGQVKLIFLWYRYVRGGLIRGGPNSDNYFLRPFHKDFVKRSNNIIVINLDKQC